MKSLYTTVMTVCAALVVSGAMHAQASLVPPERFPVATA